MIHLAAVSKSSRMFVGLAGAVTFWACGDAHPGVSGNPQYRSLLTGDACTPDPSTFVPAAHGAPEKQDGLPKNPTGMPGDNMDDAASGITDCLGDGNSGQGDDRKHPCGAVTPGCDAAGCCEVNDNPGEPSEDPPAGGAGGTDDPTDPPKPLDCSSLSDSCGTGRLDAVTGQCVFDQNGTCPGV